MVPCRVEQMNLRIGGVPYGVGAPLLAGMEEDSGVHLVKEPPTSLIEALRAGRLDAALVSSIEAVRRPGYRIAAGLGIASRSEVRSVRAFRRPGPIRLVGLDAGSATSAALLRVLLRGPRRSCVEGEPAFEPIRPTRKPAELPHDLVMLIGDAGLTADAGDREVWDMGLEWRTWTGLPFVFALWLIRPGADAGAVLSVLRRARARGRKRREVDGTFGAVHYDLDDADVMGLRRFWAEAAALGLAENAISPQFVGAETPPASMDEPG
ncbi:MAG: hypothetical protein Fur0037_17610 [Planctomycetota bacterium]